MWWLDPGKELLQAIFNRVMAPYLENLDMNQVNYGIASGSLTLRNLRLKREALDKFRLPVDVVEGNLGKLSLVIPWRNFNKPLEATVEDLFLLVKPAAASKYDPEDDERRKQAGKQERLRAAETIQDKAQTQVAEGEDSMKNQGFIDNLIAKIINNFQLTVKNIHVRYEDSLSCPGHPFAAGLTLSDFTVLSVNGEWKTEFVPTTAGAIHKLLDLKSFAIYFNTDTESIEGLPVKESVERFRTMICTPGNPIRTHQFILKPISGQAKLIMNRTLDDKTPKFDVETTFEEIGFVLDEHQYRDIISMVDMYHFFLRQQQYRKLRPPEEQIQENRARAMLKFAGKAILDQVHEKHAQWTWAHFAARRDDRKRYVHLYKQKLPGTLKDGELAEFDQLEAKLSYEDLRFYRSIARSELRKDLANKRKHEEDKRKESANSGGGWLGWIWGGQKQNTEEILGVQMNDQRRKELFDALDYDDRAAVAASFEPAKDSLKMRVAATLNKGSLTLRMDPHGSKKEVVALIFDELHADVLQRPTNFETTVTLGDLHINDGTTEGTLYPDVVRIKDGVSTRPVTPQPEVEGGVLPSAKRRDPETALLMVKFEQNPLDERADTALTVRLNSMEIVYHKGYVEAVYNFFKPPETQMESVAALMDVASETLEGFRNQTRAGLEHALQMHKTVDVKMSLQAPIIIIPEDVRSKKGIHLIVDAGHLSIGSELVDKKDVQAVYTKRNQEYTEEDYRRLEGLMYDKFSLALHDTQFIIGDDLDACLAALKSTETERKYHLLERTSISFSFHNSILPSALQLAKMRVTGTLPSLAVNLSNVKYKALMRIIDIAIPKLGEDTPTQPRRPPRTPALGIRAESNVFSQTTHEYTVSEDPNTAEVEGEDEFFEANQGGDARLDLKQHQFEFKFKVERLHASLSKAGPDGVEHPLAELVMEQFLFDFNLAKLDMNIDLALRSITMNYLEPGQESFAFLASESTTTDEDLLKVHYVRAQKESPEFMTTFESIDQAIDVRLSTILLRARPEPVLAMYDFLMTTFVPEKPSPTQTPKSEQERTVVELSNEQTTQDKIRVRVDLKGVNVSLINNESSIATLALSTANIALLLRGGTLRLGGRLGDLVLVDDTNSAPSNPLLKNLLSIEGGQFADFSYETFDPAEEDTFPGYNSMVELHAGALKFNFLETPLQDIYAFVMKLARLKGVYDAAADAAVQRASEVQRMKFDISMKSPIVVFPKDPETTKDALVLKLGEIIAKNNYEGDISRTQATLKGIRFSSHTHRGDIVLKLKMISDVDINANVIQTSGIDREKEPDYPETQVSVTLSDIKLALTQNQYCDLIAITQAIPRITAAEAEDVSQSPPVPSRQKTQGALNASNALPAADLAPELSLPPLPTPERPSIFTTLDLELKIGAVKLQLYDVKAFSEDDLKDCGIARFALNDNVVRLKMLSSGAGEAEIILKSFTVSNTRPGPSRFREIIPAANHERNQFMVLYTMSGGPDSSATALVTIDSPKVLFALDPVFALAEFFMSPFQTSPSSEVNEDLSRTQVIQPKENNAQPQSGGLYLRVDLHDLSVTLLENDADPNTQTIQLYIQQVLMSQQGVLALKVAKLGMSLAQMGKLEDSVRFLDDMDITLSMDSRKSANQQMTSIEISAQPIVLRASQRDINLITAIVTRATQLASKPQDNVPVPAPEAKTMTAARTKSATANKSKILTEQPKLIMSKEKLKASIDGIRLVLIGEGHEQPMVHFRTKPFIVSVQDWTGEMHAAATIAFGITYWNLTNSHWEPLIEPWTVSANVSTSETGGMITHIFSHQRLDVNISTTFVELALAAAAAWSKENLQPSKRARGAVAPYKIRNNTGLSLQLWSDHEAQAQKIVALADGQEIDWRFDDWKSLREHVSATGRSSIGIKFQGKPWEQLRNIAVDRGGEYTYVLRPRIDKILHRMLVEVVVEENVKIITLRSTYNIVNDCLYPMEVILVDSMGKPAYSVQKIAPKESYSLPIEAVTLNRLKIRPDAGFGYNWSHETLKWEDLVSHQDLTISCRSGDNSTVPFRLNLWTDFDRRDGNIRTYPKLTVHMQPPLELENLLPYDIKYRVHDKNTNTSASEFLRKGGLFPIHTVQLDHLILLNIALQDIAAFKPSHFMIINSDNHSEFPEDDHILIPDQYDRKLDLRLNYVRDRKGSSVKVQIYSPYIVINKTGLSFSIRSTSRMTINPKDVAGDTRPEELAKPTPFLLSHSSENGHEFVLKVGDSEWSEILDVEAPTAETDLMIPRRNTELHLGVSWAPGSGIYKSTKIITLSPRFLIKNNSDTPISYRELGGNLPEEPEIPPGGKVPVLWTRRSPDKMLKFKYPGLNGEWSTPINMEDIGGIHFRLFPPGSRSPHLFRADVEIEGATIWIIVNRETNSWPYRIINDSDYSFVMSQSGEELQPNAGEKIEKYELVAHSTLDYAWDIPTAKDKRLLLNHNGYARKLNISEVGNLPPFKFLLPNRSSRAVSIDIRADGITQVVTITNYSEQYSLYRPVRAPPGRQDTLMSQEAFEAIQEDVPPSMTIILDVEGLGLSLINRSIMEVVYLTMSNLKVEYATSKISQAITLGIGHLQIDNQLPEATFNVVLQPTPVSKQGVPKLPTVQASVVLLNDQSYGVLFIKYASVLLQALTIQLDEDFLMEVIDLTKFKGGWEDQSPSILIQSTGDVPEPSGRKVGGQEIYFEGLFLQPIRLNVSFVRAERTTKDRTSDRNPLATFLHAFTMAIGNIDSAPLEFKALILQDVRLSQPVLVDRMFNHYKQAVLLQLYRVLGSIDFIGNPVGLFTNVSSGVMDIFYEPYQGVVMHGNRELGTGLAKGAASFLKKATFGITDSLTKFTSSVGKGLSSATFDAEYQERRRLAQRRNKPRHAFYGFASGANALLDSVASAGQGVVQQPVAGLQREGGLGFMKGIAKGVAGIVIKPAVGVVDFASNVTEGFRNTTTMFDPPSKDRVRHPRHLPHDGVLNPYGPRESIGQTWMREVDRGRFKKDLYVAHVEIPGGDNVVLLTMTHVISFYSIKLRLDWVIKFSQLSGVNAEDNGILFADRSGREYDRFVYIPERETKTWFFTQIEKVVTAYNAKKRLEA